jgi:myo-inositol-1(or 4)-monophosphatase
MSTQLKSAVDAAQAAGKIHRRYYGKALRIEMKKDNNLNLVTQVDKACEKKIQAILHQRTPGFNFWGEESGRGSGDSQYTWLVDPLDGTTNFAHAYPFFCVSIALIQGKEPVLGVVYDAMNNECFTAEKGQGARLNGKRIRVSAESKLSKSLLATGFAYGVKETLYNFENFKNFVLNSQGVRRDGSAAMNMAYVAAGRFEGFWERGIQAWDMAAAVCLIREAGGQVTDISGKPYDLLAQNALASNGKIHSQMRKLLWAGPDEKRWVARYKKSLR